MQRKYQYKPSPLSLWTKELILLFDLCKTTLTHSPVLTRFDSNKPVFFKTDWSAEVMGHILLQLDNSAEAKAATTLLFDTGEYFFDLLPTSPRLRSVAYYSRANTCFEINYHSFVGVTDGGHWTINHLRRYLLGKILFWMCDCTVVKEILKHFGPVHQLRRWNQEMMGYEYVFVHRPAKTMKDIDALSRHVGEMSLLISFNLSKYDTEI